MVKNFLVELAHLMDKHGVVLNEDNFFDGENNFTHWQFVKEDNKDSKIDIHQVEKFVSNYNLVFNETEN